MKRKKAVNVHFWGEICNSPRKSKTQSCVLSLIFNINFKRDLKLSAQNTAQTFPFTHTPKPNEANKN